MLSPLYRLRRVKPEEMTKEDEVLIHLSNILRNDEEKASKIWELWRVESGIDEDIGIKTMKNIFSKIT